MKLDCRTAIILKHPSENKVLLLKRASYKKLLPNLITGIGGKIELDKGEGEDLEKALLREFVEETKIDVSIISDIKLRLTTSFIRDGIQWLIFWYTGQLNEIPADLSCNEGDLGFYYIDNLPIKDFTPPASQAIPFILSINNDKAYNGVFKEDGRLLINN